MIYAVGIAVNAWIVSFDLRIAWGVAIFAACVILVSYVVKTIRKRRAGQ